MVIIVVPTKYCAFFNQIFMKQKNVVDEPSNSDGLWI